MLNKLPITIPENQLRDFSERWQIEKIALFGSVLREDFSDESDVDVLVRFEEGHQHTLFDLVTIEDELSTLLGYPIDLGTYASVEQDRNYLRRNEILNSLRTIYEK